ncbi:hypothetical protein FRE64_16425 (plasmid) [Euhalothece natronophila Z-M001]|uniref:Uncharacterized protein n=1 Tax=Euhalothece natronophila Z-M001 TaxID=522448 RepID=A0A5B8NR01_9CHRO|nr:hypothetical protein FRE64_16425 [Euhalothece natronophila Z-M001]
MGGGSHSPTSNPQQRYRATKVLLDQLRKQLALDAELLQRDRLERLQQETGQVLNDNWKIDPSENLRTAKWATEELCELLEANRQEIESGELVVYLIDECHLLWGDVCGYGWERLKKG